MSDLCGLEIIECAIINMESVARMNPGLAAHPIWLIAMEQLRNGVKKLEEETA